MYENLNHLNEEEINTLIKRYYSNEKIAVLLSEYKINVRPGQLYKLFPSKEINQQCPYCRVNLFEKYASKGSSWRKAEIKCPECGHMEGIHCWCKNCSEKINKQKEVERIKAQEEFTRKQDFMKSLLKIDDSRKIDFGTLDFSDKIHLGALLREGIDEDFNFIHPIETFTNPLAPTESYQNEIIKSLSEKNIIVIHPESDPACFVNVEPSTGDFRYYPLKVKWSVNVKQEDLNKVPLIDSIINPSEGYDSEDAFLLWRKIALNESIEYFSYSVNTIMGIKYSIGEKTISVLEDLLNDFSVSQVYNIIYRSTNNALRFQKEQRTSTHHAANTIIGNAQSYAERAKLNNWDLQRYGRRKECPESALSRFFFERVLKIGYAGFNDKPHR